VLCTAPADGTDARLARTLVAAGVAACVNLIPGVRSVYVWQDEVHDDAETLMVIKTAAPEALADAIRAHHPYDTPEIVVLDVDEARSDARYVGWVRQLTAPEAP